MQEDEIDFLGLWDILMQYRLRIVAITGSFALTFVILALVMTEMYRATTTVSELSASPTPASALASQFGGLAAIAGVDLGAFGADTGEARAILNSRRLVEEFIVREELLPVLFADWAEPGTLWEGVEYFREEVLSINDDPRTGLTVINVEWTDPRVAAEWANDIVALANEIVRDRELRKAQTGLEFLNRQIAETSVVELQQVLYGMIETELKTLMLANAREEFAFAVIDRAVPPEQRFSPRRTLMVILGTLLGGVVSLFVVMLQHLVSRERARRASQRPIP